MQLLSVYANSYFIDTVITRVSYARIQKLAGYCNLGFKCAQLIFKCKSVTFIAT